MNMSLISTAIKGSSSLTEYFSQKLGFSEDEISAFLAVLETVETIVEKKARPHIFEWEKEGSKIVNGEVKIPESMQKVLDELIKENQLNSLFIPQELGGLGYTELHQVSLTQLLAQYDISLQILLFISLSVIEALTVYHKPNFDPILDKFSVGDYTGYVGFTEPGAGSNLENVKTTSELDGDEYVLNGTKIFISNGGHAKCGLVLARNMVNGKQEGHNVFIVEGLDGITPLRLEDKSGLHVNPTAQLQFDNVRVPKENIIATPGEGYKKVLERLMGMRTGVSAQGLGAAQRAYELASKYADEREQFGKPIKSFDGVSRKLRAMEETIPRMRLYTYMGAYALDRYYKGYIPPDIGATGEASEKMAAKQFPNALLTGLAHYQVSSSKIYCAEIANYILYDAQQIFGGNGFIKEYEINKITRDIRVLPIYEGTTEIHEFIVSKAQQALSMLPKFKKVSDHFENTTVYERILYEKFPKIKNII